MAPAPATKDPAPAMPARTTAARDIWDRATTADRDKPDGALTIVITPGAAPDGGISTTSCGSTPIIRSGALWTHCGSTRMATTTTTATGRTHIGGIRTIRISSTPIILIGFHGSPVGTTPTAPTTRSTTGTTANGGTTRTRPGFSLTIP